MSKAQLSCNFVGHPLIDAIHNQPAINQDDFRTANKLSDKPIIALLPGSRKQEITKMLSIMLSIVNDFPDYQFMCWRPSQDFFILRTLYN
jgi:lipid-A-disaccharide synthase